MGALGVPERGRGVRRHRNLDRPVGPYGHQEPGPRQRRRGDDALRTLPRPGIRGTGPDGGRSGGGADFLRGRRRAERRHVALMDASHLRLHLEAEIPVPWDCSQRAQ